MCARRIRTGSAAGKATVCSRPVSFLGGVSPDTGIILEPECESKGQSIAGKVFCFPFGKGSTVGSYAMYQLRLNDVAPSAIVNEVAEPIVATGAIIADIPMIDGIDISLLRTGDSLRVDADGQVLEVENVQERHVVTSILRWKGRVLLLKRSPKVGSYAGRWAGVSGFIREHETDEEAALRELHEEAGLRHIRPSRRLEPMRFRDASTVWCVHPFLFEVRSGKVEIDWEHDAFEWVPLDELPRYSTVPGLESVIARLLH
jgi:predicted aconitase with swiveling domain/8-oxo-dGTP pyrophosphatase MutT (NUDIX family)